VADFERISIDFDVFKALTALRESPSDSYNDVLRRMLDLPSAEAVGPSPDDGDGAWHVGGVVFPTGTEFRARLKRKGTIHTARVEDGALVCDGESYDSPSAAASAIANHAVNGWKFWECRFPGRGDWIMIDSLRGE
jgi:hypothetical protein